MTNRPRGVAWPFWKRLKDAQADIPLTDTELQRLSGVARTTVDRLEHGKRPPQARVIHALADAVHIDRDEALRLAGLKADEQPPDTADVRRAVEASSTYTPEQRAMLLQMMDTFDQVNRGSASG
jgi:transcriptional regulator with XRE-family HTH domain